MALVTSHRTGHVHKNKDFDDKWHKQHDGTHDLHDLALTKDHHHPRQAQYLHRERGYWQGVAAHCKYDSADKEGMPLRRREMCTFILERMASYQKMTQSVVAVSHVT